MAGGKDGNMKQVIQNFLLAGTALALVASMPSSAMAKEIVWPATATSTLWIRAARDQHPVATGLESGLRHAAATDADGKPIPHITKSWSTARMEPNTPSNCTRARHVTTAARSMPPMSDLPGGTRLMPPNPASPGEWGPISAIEIVDPLTVRFQLEESLYTRAESPSLRQLLFDHLRQQPEHRSGTTAAIGSGP